MYEATDNTRTKLNCTNAQTDLNYINSTFNYNNDTEPDLFQVSAPGLSCQFVFDNNNTIRTIPYQDLEITPTYDTASGTITSFAVINDQGVRYVFSEKTATTITTTTSAGPGATPWPESNIKYYKTQYNLYYGGVSFTSSWQLSSINDAAGNQLSLGYTLMGTATDRKQVEFYVGGAARQPLYVINQTNEVKCLTAVTGPTTASFTYGVYNNNVKEGTLINTITVRGVTYLLKYANLIFNKNQSSFRNSCLRAITTDQCDSPLNYFFEYEGESTSAGSSQYTELDSAYKFTLYSGRRNLLFGNITYILETINLHPHHNEKDILNICYYPSGPLNLRTNQYFSYKW